MTVPPPLPERPAHYLADEPDDRLGLLAALARSPRSEIVVMRDGIARAELVVWTERVIEALDGPRYDADPESVEDQIWLLAETGLLDKVTITDDDQFVIDVEAGANAIVGVIARAPLHSSLADQALTADHLIAAACERADQEVYP